MASGREQLPIKHSETMRSDGYSELYSRNWPIIPKETQKAISKVRLSVGGCGSTGGAFIDGALRLGLRSFKLADNGDYEMNNLNRQMVEVKDIGKNKGVVYGEKILRVNKEAQVKVYEKGLTEHNIHDFLKETDLVFDAVDVTTKSGMRMKLLLHEEAAAAGLPVASALDLGYTQWLQSYDYRRSDVRPLNGKIEEAKKCEHPLKALVGPFCPVEQLPLEITVELIRLLQDPAGSACQLGGTCFLLSSMVTPYILHFLSQKSLPPLIQVDMLATFQDKNTTNQRRRVTEEKHQELRRLLEGVK